MVAVVLALLAPVAVVVIALLLVTGYTPAPETREWLTILLSALVLMAKDVYGFEFGSSRGSRNKDARKD